MYSRGVAVGCEAKTCTSDGQDPGYATRRLASSMSQGRMDDSDGHRPILRGMLDSPSRQMMRCFMTPGAKLELRNVQVEGGNVYVAAGAF